MVDKPLGRAGNAIIWQGIQLIGNKFIYFIRLLILARILIPEDFGLVAIAVTAVGFFQSISDVGMTPALIQVQDSDESQYDTAWTIGMFRALGILGITIISAPLIAKTFAEPNSINIIRLLAIRPLLEASSSIKLIHFMWRIEFRPLVILKLVEALITAIVSILLAISLGVWGMVIGILAGAAITTILSYIVAPYKPRFFIDRFSMKKLFNFGRWIFLTSLIGVFSQYILRTIITRQTGAEGLGLYFMASQLALLPSEVSSGVVGSVAFSLFARLQHDIDQIKKAFRTIIISLATLLYPICVLIFVLAPTFVVEVLGSNWSGTESIIKILSIATMIGIFGDTVVELLKGLNKADKRTYMLLSQAVVLVIFALFLTKRYGIVGAALASLPAILVSQFVGIFFVKELLPQPFSGFGLPIRGIIITSILGGVISFILGNFLNGLLGFIIILFGSVWAIICFNWMINRSWIEKLAQDIALFFPGITEFIRISCRYIRSKYTVY